MEIELPEGIAILNTVQVLACRKQRSWRAQGCWMLLNIRHRGKPWRRMRLKGRVPGRSGAACLPFEMAANRSCNSKGAVGAAQGLGTLAKQQGAAEELNLDQDVMVASLQVCHVKLAFSSCSAPDSVPG